MTRMSSFKWKDYKNWATLAQNCLSIETRDCLMSASSETYKSADDSYSLCPLFGGETECGKRIDEFAADFFGRVTSIRAFHCTRVETPASFNENGILAKDLNELLDELFALLKVHVPSVSYSDIEAASKKAFPNESPRSTAVNVGIDDRFLIDRCGHYLLYGSESILAVVRQLEEAMGQDLAYLLKTRGNPTVVEVDIPIDMLDAPTQLALAREILFTYAYNSFHKKNEARQLDFGIRLQDGVPSQWVAGSYHPINIRDPFGNPSRR